MTVLTDPPEAVRQTLYANWNLHGNLDREHIDFNTGVPAGNRKYPSIEISPVSRGNKNLTIEWIMQSPYLFVHVWERPRTTEKDALANSKNRRNRMVEHIYDLLAANQILIRDMEWLHAETEFNADQYSAVEANSEVDRSESSLAASEGDFYPILHTVIPLRGIRWRNSTLGGIPANR